MRPALRLALATAAYGLVHSALASRTAKRIARRAAGERVERAFYRPFFILQSVVTTAALFLYAARLPTRTLYRVRGREAWLLRTGQAALVLAYATAREVGIGRITGLEAVLALARGEEVPPPPVAQGPETDLAGGGLTEAGPFRWSRHPLNFAPVPVFWLTPHLTTRRLAFNLVGTLYLVLGSLHEERRLREAYGAAYREYERNGPPSSSPGRAPSASSPGRYRCSGPGR